MPSATKTTLLTLATLALFSPQNALAESLELRVAIEENVSQVRIGSSVNATITDASTNQTLGEIQGMNGFTATTGGRGIALDKFSAPKIAINPKDPNGVVWIGDRWYRGRTLITPSSGGLTAINYVDLESYLYSVLGGEMNGNWPQEALKAQAVAARSYALYRRNRDGNSSFDLCDTARCQVYRGVQDESTGTQTAVTATAGQVLTYNGTIIEALFHSSSGGHTENVEDVWGTRVPYLRAVQDYDQNAPVFSWNKIISRNELGNIVGLGPITAVNPVGNPTAGGSYRQLEFISGSTKKRVTTETLRDNLNLRSAKITIVPQIITTKSSSKDQTTTSFVIQGKGFGHGLGMSQYGAKGMAERGLNYQQIALHFFQNTKLAKIDPR
ncbi:MAG: SpoIID/LytB domain-containing protein [Cyanobacteria bacterium]|nr:SpoIID/LytB domain-containing protein [Cyanobacteriota bacterium]